MHKYAEIQQHHHHSIFIAIADSGEMFSWGRGDQGQLGVGEPRSHSTPRLVTFPSSLPARHCPTPTPHQY